MSDTLSEKPRKATPEEIAEMVAANRRDGIIYDPDRDEYGNETGRALNLQGLREHQDPSIQLTTREQSALVVTGDELKQTARRRKAVGMGGATAKQVRQEIISQAEITAAQAGRPLTPTPAK